MSAIDVALAVLALAVFVAGFIAGSAYGTRKALRDTLTYLQETDPSKTWVIVEGRRPK